MGSNPTQAEQLCITLLIFNAMVKFYYAVDTVILVSQDFLEVDRQRRNSFLSMLK